MRKKIKLSIFLILLIATFIFSMNFNISEFVKVNSNVYGAEKKKAESSTSTTKAAEGTDMTELLARLINGEARGESYQGQVGVGAVILNRVNSPQFPNTISAVIYQKVQFSCVTDVQFDKKIETVATIGNHRFAVEE